MTRRAAARATAAAGLALFLVAAAAPAEKSIVGVWYEDLTYGGARVISVWNIKSDGTFTSLYRRCLQKGESDSADFGEWTYANGRLRTKSLASGWPVLNEYQTQSNDGHIWVYRGVAGDGFQKYGAVQFRDIRVGPDSKLPTCDLSS